MTRISDEFSRNFMQDTVAPPSDKDKTEANAKGKGATGPGASPSLTLESAQQPTTTSTGAPPPLVPPPTTNPNFVMMQVQSLQSKMSGDQMKSSSDRTQVDQDKMRDAVKTYNDNIKKEEEAKKKAHHKGLISKIVDIVEDTVEITAGAALCFVPGGQIAGAALLATGIINTTDQALTGQLGGKAVLTGKDAEIMNYCSMGATVAVGVATCGAGLLTSGGAVATDVVTEGTSDAVEMTEMTTQTAADTGDISQTTANVVTDTVKAGKAIDDIEEVEDVADLTEDAGDLDDVDGSGDGGSSDDIEMTEMRGSSNVDQMEAKFEDEFSQDVVEDSGSSSDGDDGGGRVSERELAVKGMKVGTRVFKGIVGLVNAGGGIAQGANAIEIGYLTKKADDYAADATKADEGIGEDNMDMQSVLGTLQNQIKAFETINSDLTGVIMDYAQAQTDTAVQGYA